MKCISLEYKSKYMFWNTLISDEIRNKIKLSIKHFMFSVRLLLKCKWNQSKMIFHDDAI